jgi:hypothetical protein
LGLSIPGLKKPNTPIILRAPKNKGDKKQQSKTAQDNTFASHFCWISSMADVMSHIGPHRGSSDIKNGDISKRETQYSYNIQNLTKIVKRKRAFFSNKYF